MNNNIYKIADFGVAIILDRNKINKDENLYLLSVNIAGAKDYMGPEQRAGKISIDGKSDIYSLGVTAYELIYGTKKMRSYVKKYMK